MALRRLGLAALAIIVAVPAFAGLVLISGGRGASGPPALPSSYSTTFAATENPISESGVWRNGLADGTDWNDVRTASGRAYGTAFNDGPTYDDSVASLDPSQFSFGADQSAEGVVYRSSPGYSPSIHEIELLLNWTISNGTATGYECNFAVDGSYAEIVRWNGNLADFTYLDSRGISAPANGDVMKCAKVGSTITMYVNNVEVFNVTDSTWNAGAPGVGFYAYSGATLANYGWQSVSFTTP